MMPTSEVADSTIAIEKRGDPAPFQHHLPRKSTENPTYFNKHQVAQQGFDDEMLTLTVFFVTVAVLSFIE